MKSLIAAGILVSLTATTEQIRIKGSNTFGEEIGPRLVAAYAAEHPTVEITIERQGSNSGIQALLDGEADIAASSRPMNEDENRLVRSRKLKIRQDAVGHYGVAVVVNEKNPLRGLTDRQVRDIFTGAVSNWKDVGGRDAPISIFIRGPEAGTHLGFQELAMERRPYSPSARPMASYPDLIKEVAADENAVGYASMHLAAQPGVKALRINGVPPNDASVIYDTYPYLRMVRFYSTDKASKDVRDFIRFVQSSAGQRIVEECGFVRIASPTAHPFPTGP